MRRRFEANYSLWPPQARPRPKTPLKVAAQCFALGFVCAIAVYIGFDSVSPASKQGPSSFVEHSSLVLGPTVASAPKQSETENGGSYTEPRAAKTTFPIKGTKPTPPSATIDGRGGDGVAEEASIAGTATSGTASSVIRDETTPNAPAQEASPDKATPAVAAEPPAKPHKKIARENRARPSGYAERFRTKSDKARHAERRRLKREAPIRYAPRYRREQFFPFYPAYGANWF
jgi:hypothetical protein